MAFAVVGRAGVTSCRVFGFGSSSSSLLRQHVTRRRFPVVNTSFQPVLSLNVRFACSKTQPQSQSQSQSQSQNQPCKNEPKQAPEPSALSLGFWDSPYLWRRAGINTFRCLIGCSLGDFSAMWFLQATYPDMAVGLVMGISSEFKLSQSLCSFVTFV